MDGMRGQGVLSQLVGVKARGRVGEPRCGAGSDLG